MQTDSIKLPEGTEPRFVVSLYQDINDNWFGSVQARTKDGCLGLLYTATFTRSDEALFAALSKMSLPRD